MSAPALPTLTQLKFFLAVMDAGSFSAAAAELGVSQSSLSESLKALEKTVDQALLRRSRQGIGLTPAGQRTLSHARATVSAAQDFMLAARSGQNLSGTLKIVTVRSAATHLLPSITLQPARDRGLHPGPQGRGTGQRRPHARLRSKFI